MHRLAGSRERRWAYAPVSGCVVGLLLAMVTACGGPGSGSDGATVRVAFSSEMSTSWAELAVAMQEGFFEDEGISVEPQFPGGSGDVLQSMAVKRTDIGAPTPEAVLAGIDDGQRVTMTYEWTRGPVQSLGVPKGSDIHSFSDMRGKSIGVASMASGAKVLAEAALELKGLNPSKDVKFKAVGTGVAAWDSLRRGRVDALMLWDTEYAVMENAGARLRNILPKEMGDLFSTTFIARNDWLKSSDKQMKAFGRAWAKATVWAGANPEQAVRDVWKQFPETRTSGKEGKLLKQHMAIFKGRHKVATLEDPGASKSWGKYDKKAVEHWVEFAHETDVTSKRLSVPSVYTNRFVKAYNDFDQAKVKRSARAAK